MKVLVIILSLVSAQAFAGTYNCNVTVQSDITLSTASSLIAVKNASRRCFILENKDSSIKIYVKFGSVHSATEGIVLQPNARWEAVVPSGQSVFAKAASGSPVVGVISGQ